MLLHVISVSNYQPGELAAILPTVPTASENLAAILLFVSQAGPGEPSMVKVLARHKGVGPVGQPGEGWAVFFDAPELPLYPGSVEVRVFDAAA